MTCIYVRFNNLKRTGQLRNVWVEFGFGAVWCSCRWSAQNRWRFWADLTFCWHRPYLSWILIGKTRKNNVFFRPSPERGGEGRPLPNFMAHFYHVLLSKIGKFYPKPFIFVSYLVIFRHHYHQNYHQNYHHNYHYNHHLNQVSVFSGSSQCLAERPGQVHHTQAVLKPAECLHRWERKTI